MPRTVEDVRLCIRGPGEGGSLGWADQRSGLLDGSDGPVEVGRVVPQGHRVSGKETQECPWGLHPTELREERFGPCHGLIVVAAPEQGEHQSRSRLQQEWARILR